MKKRSILALVLVALLVLASIPPITAIAAEDPMVISVAFTDTGLWDPDPANSQFAKLLLDKFNVILDPWAITWGDWQEKTRMWSASGQIPDYCLTFSDYAIWRDQGVSKGITLEKLKSYPYLYDRISQTVIPYLVDDNGLLYGLPRTAWKTSSGPVSDTGIYISKDYLAKAGYEKAPETLDEWFDYLTKCVQGDFSGKGTIGLTSNNGTIPTSKITTLPFMSNANWTKTDEGWTLTKLTDANIPMLEWNRKLYKAGLIDPELATRKSGDAEALFKEARVAALGLNGDCDMLLSYNSLDGALAGDWITIAYAPASPIDGVHYREAFSNYDGVMAFPANISDEKLDKILEMMDYFSSPEGEQIVTMGFKDINYSVDANGNYTNLCKDAKGAMQSYWIYEPIAMFGRFTVTWNFEYATQSPLHPAQNRELAQSYLQLMQSNTSQAPVNWGIELYDGKERQNMPSIDGDYLVMYFRVITGDEDIATVFNEFRQKALVKVQDAIDETNAFATEKGW